ncbi:hypothetical protein HYFRA_00007967 [Hymenoscyphus fraxineus]|uniref:Uncharacterized protein n=1 Tax=Hymenoscyphus fraxineus TaxID=746836 RepID=A0A9N9KNQ1_9HELO|nr:hypothetical protein HYFRA_00007967 [Hymenoscyphus fraxineus]
MLELSERLHDARELWTEIRGSFAEIWESTRMEMQVDGCLEDFEGELLAVETQLGRNREVGEPVENIQSGGPVRLGRVVEGARSREPSTLEPIVAERERQRTLAAERAQNRHLDTSRDCSDHQYRLRTLEVARSEVPDISLDVQPSTAVLLASDLQPGGRLTWGRYVYDRVCLMEAQKFLDTIEWTNFTDDELFALRKKHLSFMFPEETIDSKESYERCDKRRTDEIRLRPAIERFFLAEMQRIAQFFVHFFTGEEGEKGMESIVKEAREEMLATLEPRDEETTKSFKIRQHERVLEICHREMAKVVHYVTQLDMRKQGDYLIWRGRTTYMYIFQRCLKLLFPRQTWDTEVQVASGMKQLRDLETQMKKRDRIHAALGRHVLQKAHDQFRGRTDALLRTFPFAKKQVYSICRIFILEPRDIADRDGYWNATE